MKLGVFGGTFDPPHLGHLIVAQDAALALGLDRILFMPAGSPPHKQDRTVTAAATRLAMVQAAVAGNARFGVEDHEVVRAQSHSYTSETLRALAQKHAGAELWLLIGRDQWTEFATWREPADIVRHAHLGIIGRGDGQQPDRGLHSNVVPAERVAAVRATRIDISSSDVRRRIGVGESVRYLVPDAVIELIFRAQLYR